MPARAMHQDDPDTPLQTRRRRLLFRATHRGTHETDLLIGGFVAPRLDAFSVDELAALEEIMDVPDVDLADWLTGRHPIPESPLAPLLRRMAEDALTRAALARTQKGARA